MVRIYALKSDELVLYVGRTKRTLKRRGWEHRDSANLTTSKYIPDWVEWEIVLLEECADDLGVAREQYYYDILKPFYNYKRPGQTRVESLKAHWQTESYKAIQKAYRQTEANRLHKNAIARARYAEKKAQSTMPKVSQIS